LRARSGAGGGPCRPRRTVLALRTLGVMLLGPTLGPERAVPDRGPPLSSQHREPQHHHPERRRLHLAPGITRRDLRGAFRTARLSDARDVGHRVEPTADVAVAPRRRRIASLGGGGGPLGRAASV